MRRPGGRLRAGARFRSAASKFPFIRSPLAFLSSLGACTCRAIVVLAHSRAADVILGLFHRRMVRRLAAVMGALAILLGLVTGGLWWRLTSGPISLDLVTPWLTAAIEENLGDRYQVEVGGTVIERDENGRTAVRVRDIVVRDSDGTVVASAPKAEVGFSGMSLLSGRPRAESLNLVGAELSLRIDTDGKINIFAGGADKRAAGDRRRCSPPPGPAVPARLTGDRTPEPASTAQHGRQFRRVARPGSTAWASSGSTAATSPRSVSRAATSWSTTCAAAASRASRTSISASPGRSAGELALSLGSQDPDRPWLVLAAVKPIGDGAPRHQPGGAQGIGPRRPAGAAARARPRSRPTCPCGSACAPRSAQTARRNSPAAG